MTSPARTLAGAAAALKAALAGDTSPDIEWLEHMVRTLAFPSISTGVYGYPLEQAAHIAVSTVRSFDGEGVAEVTFCCFSAHDLRVYEAILAGVV